MSIWVYGLFLARCKGVSPVAGVGLGVSTDAHCALLVVHHSNEHDDLCVTVAAREACHGLPKQGHGVPQHAPWVAIGMVLRRQPAAVP